MSEHQKHINYSAATIQKYLSGEMLPAEMYVIEKAALDDPFLAEAIEGYTIAKDKKWDLALGQLKEKFANKEEATVIPFSTFKWWKSAAAIILIATTVGITYLATNKHQDSSPALADATIKNKPAEIKTANSDSAIIPSNNPEAEKNITLKKENNKIVDEKIVAAKPLISSKADSSFMYRPDDAFALNTKKQKPEDGNSNKNELNLPPADDVQISPSNAEGMNVVTNVDKSLSNQNKFNNNQAISNNNPILQNEAANAKAERQLQNELSDNSKKVQSQLNEVVITGAGISRKKSVASSSVSITTKDMKHEEKVAADAISNMASPIIDWENYKAYLSKNNRFLNSKTNIQHDKATILRFLVKKNGKISQIKITQSACKECDAEAIRLLKEGPAWQTNTGNKATGSIIVFF